MVVNATKEIKKSAKIAVMGCVVNGPGEASSCDFGVAGGKDKSAIFAKGKVLKVVENDKIIEEILNFINSL